MEMELQYEVESTTDFTEESPDFRYLTTSSDGRN